MFERSLTMLFTTGGVSICTRKRAARKFVVDRRDGKWYDTGMVTHTHTTRKGSSHEKTRFHAHDNGDPVSGVTD